LVPVASEALRLLDQACGTQVVVAVPLSNGSRSEIERRLMKLTGQKIRLEIKRVPSLVGGLVLRLGNRTVDASIKRKLQSWGLRRPTPPLLVEYQRFLDRARGIKRAEMTVALPLSEGLKRELETRLAFLAGQDIRLEIRVAPSILGGICPASGG